MGTVGKTKSVAVWLWLAVVFPAGPSHAQEGAGQPLRLVDCPTAGLMAKGNFGVDMRFFPNGGGMGQLSVGVLDRLSIGLSFGGEQIIGAQEVDWYPRVEPAIRYRLIEESHPLPALVLGYENQGYGSYWAGRYQIKSKGMFLVISKNYTGPLGQFGVHGGVNLSRENKDKDKDLSGWVGMDKSIGGVLGAVAEYDLALNDNNRAALGSGKGYLNTGVNWRMAEHLSIDLYLKNLLKNGDNDPQGSRELAIRYTEDF